RSLVRRIKERFIYPRTGYVAYRRPPGQRSRLATGLVGTAMALLAGVLMRLAPASLAWIPALQGGIIGLVWLYVASTMDLGRFFVLAVLSFAVGGLASLGGLGDTLGSGAYFGLMGLALVASGAFTLWQYWRQTRPPDGEEAEDLDL
ncbi:MAG: hypothetical protein ACYC1C_19675, partial [Chloroflexota bacterium]